MPNNSTDATKRSEPALETFVVQSRDGVYIGEISMLLSGQWRADPYGPNYGVISTFHQTEEQAIRYVNECNSEPTKEILMEEFIRIGNDLHNKNNIRSVIPDFESKTIKFVFVNESEVVYDDPQNTIFNSLMRSTD